MSELVLQVYSSPEFEGICCICVQYKDFVCKFGFIQGIQSKEVFLERIVPLLSSQILSL